MSEFVPRHPVLRVLLILLLLALLGLVGWSLSGLFAGGPAKNKAPPKISLLPDRPPPPPPPPKPEEKRPEPPKSEQKEVRVDQPREAPPQPAESLKMEGAAGDGPSAFQGGTVGNEDLSRVGNDFGGNAYNAYAQTVRRRVEQSLSRVNGLRGFPYRVEVRLWITPSGAVSRSELVNSSGNPEIDALLRSSLKELPPLSEQPPAGMPQPLRLRLTSS